ncbi:MAG: apolipoprotein N-acyltransferase [Myxococcales bacterium]|nr:apolipoprotein N-acyltransferase [Myxococcales bacterium]
METAALRSPYWAVSIGALTGGLLALAYPGFNLWPLAFVGLVPLIAWIVRERPTPRHALLAGWVAGLVLHAVTFRCLAFTVREMSGLPDPAGAAVVVLFAAAHGLREGLFALAVRAVLPARPALTTTAALGQAAGIAALWVAAEYALPALFEWHLGNALWAAPAWIQPADLIGICGVSGLCAWTAALLALQRAPVLKAGPGPGGLRIVLAVTVLAWGAYGFWRLAAIDAEPSRSVWRAALVQADATLDEKRADESRRRVPMLERAEAMTRELDLTRTDLVIWPEGALPFFWVPDAVAGPDVLRERGQPTRAPAVLLDQKTRVLGLVRHIGRPLLTGSLRQRDRLWHLPTHNSALLVHPDGTVQTYDKRILLAFGEYLPGAEWFPALAGTIPGISTFDRGVASGRFDVAGARIFVNICYEALFPAFMRREAGDADVLVNLTNDIWFGTGAAPELHLMVQQARAVELRRPLLRSTSTGITAHIDAGGVLRARTKLHERRTLRADVSLRDLDSPYRRWGDIPVQVLTAGALLWLARHVWRSRTAAVKA